MLMDAKAGGVRVARRRGCGGWSCEEAADDEGLASLELMLVLHDGRSRSRLGVVSPKVNANIRG